MNLLVWILLTAQAFAAAPAPLSFSARIQDEALAEEAIDLLHCLAERKGTSWELGLDDAPAPSVRVAEQGGKLVGVYRDEGTHEFTLEKNGWRRTCEELQPAAEAIALAPAESTPAIPNFTEAAPSVGSTKTWAWVAAGAAVLAGGFILWRAGQPDHRSLRME